MEGAFPRNVSLKIIIRPPPQHGIHKTDVYSGENENGLSKSSRKSGYVEEDLNNHGTLGTAKKVIDLIVCRLKNCLSFRKIIIYETIISIRLKFDNISLLNRSYPMEFGSEQYTSSVTQCSDSSQALGLVAPKDNDESTQTSKKKGDSASFEEGKSQAESKASSENSRSWSHGRAEPYRRYSLSNENCHVTQSRSIFWHKDTFVYGNPKEDIKNIENTASGDPARENSLFEANSFDVLDLSCKGSRAEFEKREGNDTYHNYHKGNAGYESSGLRSSVEIKSVNANKKPSLPEQLQIAKIQQQQRRSMQQQQKFLQQIRKSLEPKSSNRQNLSQASHKNIKHYGNNLTNNEQSELDNHARVKDDFYSRIPSAHLPHLPYPYFDPNHPKELPDNHPILPLLDPVYFSALYNAHGFLPPSSPSIAAAFIGTLQEALPKLPMIFPSTSSNNSSLFSQKNSENPN